MSRDEILAELNNILKDLGCEEIDFCLEIARRLRKGKMQANDWTWRNDRNYPSDDRQRIIQPSEENLLSYVGYENDIWERRV